MDLHSLALRASKNEILARYFGHKAGAAEWESVFKTWPSDELSTFELILNEIEGLDADVKEKAMRRHLVNHSHREQSFEHLKKELLNGIHHA